ncbi:hypothetical protein Tco_1236294 [Tanacetum coccineum]
MNIPSKKQEKVPNVCAPLEFSSLEIEHSWLKSTLVGEVRLFENIGNIQKFCKEEDYAKQILNERKSSTDKWFSNIYRWTSGSIHSNRIACDGDGCYVNDGDTFCPKNMSESFMEDNSNFKNNKFGGSLIDSPTKAHLSNFNLAHSPHADSANSSMTSGVSPFGHKVGSKSSSNFSNLFQQESFNVGSKLDKERGELVTYYKDSLIQLK